MPVGRIVLSAGEVLTRSTPAGPSHGTTCYDNRPASTHPLDMMATGLRRRLYVGLGLFFVGLGIVGAILPVMPTTPWLLIASFFFARSSPRLEAWLRRTPYFGLLIRDWEVHRGVRPGVKVSAITVVVLVVGSTCLFSPAPIWAKWSAAALATVGVGSILFLVPTVRTRRDQKENAPPLRGESGRKAIDGN
jgi:uncharacterized membrane protein YbaN (DUF454 family)